MFYPIIAPSEDFFLNEYTISEVPRGEIKLVSIGGKVKPLIITGHLKERYEERTKLYTGIAPEINIPFKEVFTQYVKDVNSIGIKMLKTEDDQVASRLYINIYDEDGNKLGHIESGVIGKMAIGRGKKTPEALALLKKYNIKPEDRTLTLETFMFLATEQEEMYSFRGKTKLEKDRLYKEVTMSRDKFDELVEVFKAQDPRNQSQPMANIKITKKGEKKNGKRK